MRDLDVLKMIQPGDVGVVGFGYFTTRSEFIERETKTLNGRKVEGWRTPTGFVSEQGILTGLSEGLVRIERAGKTIFDGGSNNLGKDLPNGTPAREEGQA